MAARFTTAVVFAAVFVLGLAWRAEAAPAPPDKEKPSADDVAKAEKAVNEDLDKLKAAGFTMQQVKDEAVGRAFPKYVFFGVYFRQFPVARLTPEGLNSANLYAVGPDGKAELLKDTTQFQTFFTVSKSLPPVKDDDAAKDAARAYVRLAEELHQDGFYKFMLQDDSTKTEVVKDGKTAFARAVVMAGGNGELAVTLTFDSTGQLKSATEKVNIKEGPRPICQATKLLDADPIVRRMAERDLLIMGRACRPYLDEQRAKATPELQRAIDRMWEQIVDDNR